MAPAAAAAVRSPVLRVLTLDPPSGRRWKKRHSHAGSRAGRNINVSVHNPIINNSIRRVREPTMAKLAGDYPAILEVIQTDKIASFGRK